MIDYEKLDFEYKDDRGCLYQLCHDGYKQVNISETKAGVLRGGHFHKNNTEVFYIIKGEIHITLEDNKTKDFVAKDNDFFSIKPGVVHTFEFIKDTLMVILYDKGIEEAEGKKDIYPKEEKYNEKF